MSLFISEPHAGRIFIAERRSPHRRTKLKWSVMPVAPVAADVRIEPGLVPRLVRRKAYKLFEADRLRERGQQCSPS